MERFIKKSIQTYFENIEKIERIQEHILLDILKHNMKSEYGIQNQFDTIQTLQQFQNSIPIVSYNEMQSLYERIDPNNKIVCSDEVIYYAMTSGSSGAVKYIPHTRKSLDIWSHGMIRNGYTPLQEKIDFLQGQYLLITGSDYCELKNNIRCGYISGIIPHENETISKRNLMKDINNGSYSYEEKCDKVLHAFDEHTITSCGGITSHVLNIFVKCKEERENLTKDVRFFLSTGVALSTVKDELKKVLPKDTWVANAYTGTEGAFAFSLDSYSDSVYLNYDLYFFEFEDTETLELCLLHEVDLHTSYNILVTSYNGLYRYRIGDVVQFESLKPPCIKVLGRQSASMNLIGEKYTEKELRTFLCEVGKKLDIHISNFVISGNVIHGAAQYFLIVSTTEEITLTQKMQLEEDFWKALIQNKALLKRMNSESFLSPSIHCVSQSCLSSGETLFAKNKKSGHVKMKTILDFSEFTKLSSFLDVEWGNSK